MKNRYKEIIYSPGNLKGSFNSEEWYSCGIFRYDVMTMKTLCRNGGNNRIICKNVSVKELSEQLYSDMDLKEIYIDKADLSEPVILGEIAPDNYHLMDGYHRLAKAMRQKVETLPAYFVKSDVAAQLILDDDAYKKYIIYWNTKVMEANQNIHYYGNFEEMKTEPYEMNFDADYIWNQLKSSTKGQIIELLCYPQGKWFTLLQINNQIFAAEADKMNPSVQCKRPEIIDRDMIEAMLPYAESWLSGNKDTIKEASAQCKCAKYVMACVRIFA